MEREEKIQIVAELLREAESILFITGAGVSAESGLPTYRGVGGLYEGGQLAGGEMPIEQALSGLMWRQRPEVTWRHLLEIERACRQARPNRAHEVMAQLERTRPRVWVLTQNVDGLHRAAQSRQVIPIHGSLHALECTECEWTEQVADLSAYDELPGDELPSCPACGGLIRPQVVLFGEMLPPAAVERYERELRRGFDLILSVGTTSQFPYIAAPLLEAARRQTPSVEINPTPTPVSHAATYVFREPCAALLDELLLASSTLPPPHDEVL